MHYYPHHIGDFIRDTSRLNDSQCMAYLRLIWMYYENESPLENDIEILAFKIGSDKDTVNMLLQCYFYANAMRWHHKRIDFVLSEYKNKSEKAKNSANKRWNHANAMRTHSERNANGMLTNNQEPITNNHIKKHTQKKEFFAGIDKQLVNDYLAVRKAKRAAKVSQTVYDGLLRESNLAGIDLSEALRVCIERNWVGFKAEWYLQLGTVNGKAKFKNKSDVMSDSQFESWLNTGENNARIT